VVPSSAPQEPAPASSNGALDGRVLGSGPGVVDAQLRLPAAPRTEPVTGTVQLPALDGLDAMPGSFYGLIP
jgi:hypothetical protein